jgi:hypothetical protein
MTVNSAEIKIPVTMYAPDGADASLLRRALEDGAIEAVHRLNEIIRDFGVGALAEEATVTVTDE